MLKCCYVKLVENTGIRLKTILIFLSFLLLYFTFRSSQFDLSDAIALDAGALYSPNHMLCRPIADLFWKILKSAGYIGRSVYVLQILNVFYGSLAVAIAFVAYQKLGASSWAAMCGCFLLGTSFTHWSQSTEATYIVIAGMFSAAALLCSAILIQKSSPLTAFFLGLCFAAATLSWQAAVLLFPLFIWPLRHRLKEVMIFAITSTAILVIAYIAAGMAQGNTTAGEIFYWAIHHRGANIPSWGKFEIERIPLTLISAIQSIQIYAPPWFFRSSNHLVPWGAGAGAICLLLLGVAILIRGIQLAIRQNSKLIWLFSGYLSIAAFVVWWDPMDLKYFFVPNIFLCAVAAVVLNSWKSKVLTFGALIVMALVTFTFSIWPRHVDPGINMRKAECVHRNLSANDKVISTDWNFTAELLYFYHIRTVEIVSLGASFQPDHQKLIDHIYEELEKTRSGGGKIFIVDPQSYNPEYLKWLAEQTTFTLADFGRFPGNFAFQCEDLKYLEVTSLQR